MTHSLRADGFDASEDGTGRGTPLVPTVAATHKSSHDRHRADVEQTLIPQVVGTLSDGAHNGGGLNGQDAYSGRIIPVIHEAD